MTKSKYSNFIQQNPVNKYRLVHYQPSIEDLKNSLLDLEKNHDGHYDNLERFLKRNNYSTVSEVFSHQNQLFDLVHDIHEGYPDYFLGLEHLETGRLEYRFYERIYSYHSDQGYAIAQKQSDRDYWGADQTHVVVSLKTGKEFDGEFVDHVSGIKDLKFHGVIYYSKTNWPLIYQIDEEKEELIELDIEQDIDQRLLELEGPSLTYLKNELEYLSSPNFYKNDELFISYIIENFPEYYERFL